MGAVLWSRCVNIIRGYVCENDWLIQVDRGRIDRMNIKSFADKVPRSRRVTFFGFMRAKRKSA